MLLGKSQEALKNKSKNSARKPKGNYAIVKPSACLPRAAQFNVERIKGPAVRGIQGGKGALSADPAVSVAVWDRDRSGQNTWEGACCRENPWQARGSHAPSVHAQRPRWLVRAFAIGGSPAGLCRKAQKRCSLSWDLGTTYMAKNRRWRRGHLSGIRTTADPRVKDQRGTRGTS